MTITVLSTRDPLLSSNDEALLWEATKSNIRNARVAAYTRLNELRLLKDGAGVEYDAIRYIDVTEVAKMIRKALRDAFPGRRFTVKSERFAGGTSIRVGYSEEFALHKDQVMNLNLLIRGFESHRFDGMTDMASSITSWLSPQGRMSPAYCGAFGTNLEENHPNPGDCELVFSGAKFVSAQQMF